MESSLHFHPLKKDASLCSSTECSQMTPQKCEQLALNSSTKEVKWIVPEKCSNSAGQLWCEKKLNTVRVTKFCSKQHSDQQVPEKTRCFTSEGWRYWHFKADFPWRATSYWQFWKGHCFGQSYKHQSSQHCERYTTPRCVVVLSWCYPPIDRLSQYQCGQQRKYTQANDCPVSQWERTWQN